MLLINSHYNGTIKILKYYFYLSMLFVDLRFKFKLCFHQESRNRYIQHSGNTDFSSENFFSLSFSHFCLLLSSVHCFSQCTPDQTNKQQKKTTSKQNLPHFFALVASFFGQCSGARGNECYSTLCLEIDLTIIMMAL